MKKLLILLFTFLSFSSGLSFSYGVLLQAMDQNEDKANPTSKTELFDLFTEMMNRISTEMKNNITCKSEQQNVPIITTPLPVNNIIALGNNIDINNLIVLYSNIDANNADIVTRCFN